MPCFLSFEIPPATLWLWAVRIVLTLICLLLAFMVARLAFRLFEKNRPFLDARLANPDLALQLTGGDLVELGKIVRYAGNLPLLRNLVLDSRVFVPVYVLGIAAAILLLLGLPFACGKTPFSGWAAGAIMLTVLGAALDWRENGLLDRVLRLNAQGDESSRLQQSTLLRRVRRIALSKFFALGLVFALLALHPKSAALLPLPGLLLFGAGALGLMIPARFPRFLELAVATAGLGVAFLLTVVAWR